MAKLTQLMKRMTELMTLLRIDPAKTEKMASKSVKQVIGIVVMG